MAVKSADNPDSLRGAGLDGLVFDEAAFSRERVWTDVLRPMLVDRNGWALFLTTPNGCNWFFNLFKDACGDDWARWQRPSRENPIISAEELEEAKRKVGPRAYAQEFDAQFTEEEGAYFPVEYFPDSIWFDEWPSDDDIVLRCIACDPSLGKTKVSDYSALVMLARTRDAYYVMADLDKRPCAKIVADALRWCREFRASMIGFETVGFQELLKDDFDRQLAQTNLDVEALGISNGPEISKTKRILRLDAPLADSQIKFLRGHHGTKLLVDQLRGFPLTMYHDDGPDALEMAIRLCDEDLAGRIRRTGPEMRLMA
ncbi:MAG: terminase family protein [Planctomycetaceae bacterium]|nr:terminase family protein [Planctomycetaceae bacterium]